MVEEEVQVFKFKVALLGDSSVGKTSLVKRFVYDEFDDKYIVTLGAKTVAKTVILKTENGETVECDLQVWDVLGQKRFSLRAEEVPDRDTIGVTARVGGKTLEGEYVMLGRGEARGYPCRQNVPTCPNCHARVEACICG